MKTRDWTAIVLLFLLGTFCVGYAAVGLLAGEIGTLNKLGSRLVLQANEPLSFFLSVGAFSLIGFFCIGFSFQIRRTSKDDGFE